MMKNQFVENMTQIVNYFVRIDKNISVIIAGQAINHIK